MTEPATAHPALDRLLAWWRSKAAADRLPAREAIAPVEIMPLLPHLLMLTPATDGLRIDWTGTGVKDACGIDLAGRRLAETPLAAIEPGAALERAAAGEPALVEGRFAAVTGRLWRCQLLLLPLAADGRRVDAMLGGLIVWPVGRPEPE